MGYLCNGSTVMGVTAILTPAGRGVGGGGMGEGCSHVKSVFTTDSNYNDGNNDDNDNLITTMVVIIVNSGEDDEDFDGDDVDGDGGDNDKDNDDDNNDTDMHKPGYLTVYTLHGKLYPKRTLTWQRCNMWCVVQFNHYGGKGQLSSSLWQQLILQLVQSSDRLRPFTDQWEKEPRVPSETCYNIGGKETEVQSEKPSATFDAFVFRLALFPGVKQCFFQISVSSCVTS